MMQSYSFSLRAIHPRSTFWVYAAGMHFFKELVGFSCSSE